MMAWLDWQTGDEPLVRRPPTLTTAKRVAERSGWGSKTEAWQRCGTGTQHLA